MRGWRPSDWDNLIEKMGDIVIDDVEAGADAMLGALKEQSIPPEIFCNFLKYAIEIRLQDIREKRILYEGKQGYLIFIPDK